MKKLTDKEIRRLLSARGTSKPPEDLADRIKAEIPQVLQVGGTGLEPESARMTPPRFASFRPFWLLAASLLVVIGAGFMVVRLLAPSENLARRIALDGVTVVKDVVVTVPERSTVERQRVAAAMSFAKSDKKAELPAAPPKSRAVAPATPGTGGKPHLPAEAETREARALPAAGVPAEPAVTMPKSRMAEEAAIAGDAAVSDEARSAAVADKMQLAAAPAQAASGSILVTVRDVKGQPVAGASVRLDLADRPDVNCGSRETGAGGAATFCCVAPGTYRVCAQVPGFLPSTTRVVVAPSVQLTVPLTIDRPPADGKEHPWTCPTAAPPAGR